MTDRPTANRLAEIRESMESGAAAFREPAGNLFFMLADLLCEIDALREELSQTAQAHER